MATRDRSQGVAFSYSEKPIVIRKSEDVVAPKPIDERIQQIKNNLDRLQKLHHKLHAVLDELSATSRKGKA